MTQKRLTKHIRHSLEKNKHEVIDLLSQGVTTTEIARRYKVTWVGVYEFTRRHKPEILRLQQQVETELQDVAIANKVVRIRSMNDRWLRLHAILEARANDTRSHNREPGWEEGVMSHTLKSVGAGKHQIVIDEYKTDTAILQEMRALERAAAEELGQLPKAGDIQASMVIFNNSTTNLQVDIFDRASVMAFRRQLIDAQVEDSG